MRTYNTVAGEGRYRVQLMANLTGEGINVLLTGGEKPHIGAVVMSIPRKSSTSEGLSSDSWVLPVPGHKDVEAAKPVAEMLCRAMAQTIVVTAGIHIERAENWELDLLLQNSMDAARQLLGILDNE